MAPRGSTFCSAFLWTTSPRKTKHEAEHTRNTGVAYDLDLGAVPCATEGKAADAAEAVESNFDGHCAVVMRGARRKR
eukprot:1610299-Rhodomonas_salina.2